MFSAEVSLPFCIMQCYLVYATFVLGRVLSVLYGFKKVPWTGGFGKFWSVFEVCGCMP